MPNKIELKDNLIYVYPETGYVFIALNSYKRGIENQFVWTAQSSSYIDSKFNMINYGSDFYENVYGLFVTDEEYLIVSNKYPDFKLASESKIKDELNITLLKSNILAKTYSADEKTELDFKNIASETIKDYELEKEVIIIPTAKRHAIKINDINTRRNIYKTTNSIKSKQLINTPVSSLSIFCNEYVPEHFKEDTYIKYILTINGEDHEVVPINSHRNGKKIVRTTDSSSTADHVLYIKETIKNAYLTIKIKTPNQTETPYVSNIKILTGGN